MIGAMFTVMGLGLWRDRGAMMLAFVLPSVVFAIFASIFSSATEGDLNLQVGVAMHSEDPLLQDFIASLAASDALRLTLVEQGRESALVQQVRLGHFDAGLLVSGSLAPVATAVEAETAPAAEAEVPPFVIISEPTRRIAAISLEGLLRQHLATHSPQWSAGQAAATTEALVGGFSEAQQGQLQASLTALQEQAGASAGSDNLLEFRSVYADQPPVKGQSSIAYYAGATTILFLLLSAINAGMVSLEERQSGITERLLLGVSGRAQLLLGRFLFLLTLGFLQAATIFAVAKFGFALPVEDALGKVVAVSLAAAAASAGLALLVLSLCTTPQQAHQFSSFFVLIISAVGGSMIPRFMMPDWLQPISLFTPNAWAIEGYYGALVRGETWAELLLPCGVLVGFGLGCLVLASMPVPRGNR